MSGVSAVVPYQAKTKKTSTLPAVDAKNEIVEPLDYSFCRLNKIEEAADEEPRLSPRRLKNREKDEGEKSQSRCLRINNNNLNDITKLSDILAMKFENPRNVGWIDFSFNELTTVDPVLCEFSELQILYLHGNQISDIKEVEKLRGLQKLKKLTLHGNPLEKIKSTKKLTERKSLRLRKELLVTVNQMQNTIHGYKHHVLSLLPQLISLDFTPITKADRRTAQTWNQMNNTANKKKKAVSDEED